MSQAFGDARVGDEVYISVKAVVRKIAKREGEAVHLETDNNWFYADQPDLDYYEVSATREELAEEQGLSVGLDGAITELPVGTSFYFLGYETDTYYVIDRGEGKSIVNQAGLEFDGLVANNSADVFGFEVLYNPEDDDR